MHESYRGRGYAPIACAYLIEACQQRGCQAYWSCDADVQKPGFQTTNSYQIFKYEPIGRSHENQHNS